MRITGWTFRGAKAGSKARWFVLPAIAITGFVAWSMLSGPSDAESQSAPAPSQPLYAQSLSLVDDEIAPAETAAPATAPILETTVVEKPVIEGLRIASQSWRRGGLGSKALVTLRLRNTNDYAVKDIEIVCAFARRDGSHLTDRRRVLRDTVSKRSRKTYSGMLVGFVNVNANKAKCSLVTASRI
jgi:hypothetical protein